MNNAQISRCSSGKKGNLLPCAAPAMFGQQGQLYDACNYEPCCIYCGEYVHVVDEDDGVYPQCQNCTQDPVRKRKWQWIIDTNNYICCICRAHFKFTKFSLIKSTARKVSISFYLVLGSSFPLFSQTLLFFPFFLLTLQSIDRW